MKTNLKKLYAPILCMLLLLAIILVEQAGFMTDARAPLLSYLDGSPARAELNDPAEILLVHSSDRSAELIFVEQSRYLLDSLSMAHAECDLASAGLSDLSAYRTLLIATQHLDGMLSDVERLIDWVEAGGRLAFLIAPQNGEVYRILSRKLGVIEQVSSFEKYTSMRFLTDLLPLYAGGGIYDDPDLEDYAIRVRLSADCTVHIETGDDRHIPLLWERNVDAGRIAVCNNSLLSEKANRGLGLCVLFAVEDSVVYPIINAGMVFIDDFPAPQPEGTDERLRQDFGYNTQGFFRNHWWPDMKQLVYKYGLRYTGVLVETYNSIVEPPFEPDTDERALLRYYASELMHVGGEIGLHGYNHMPLCPDGFVYNGDNYKTWPSMENMTMALKELVRYGAKVLPESSFMTYVPPSNYLSELGQATLLAAVPQLRTISGLYLPEAGVNALVQEFQEEADGSISVPRITSGFELSVYSELVSAQELLFHGVFSHFIHPDDVLDEFRGALLGWNSLYASFDTYFSRLATAYPSLRYSTASEGAAAVQRYDRLTISRTWEDEHTLSLAVNGFVDEAWIALRTRDANFTVEGGAAYAVNDHLHWIYTETPALRVLWGAKE